MSGGPKKKPRCGWCERVLGLSAAEVSQMHTVLHRAINPQYDHPELLETVVGEIVDCIAPIAEGYCSVKCMQQHQKLRGDPEYARQ